MMKRILLALLLLCLSSPVFATNWCEDANIGGCWNIETGSGTTLDDQSSAANDGTFKGSGEPAWSATVPTSGAEGFLGTSTASISFDGTNDYVGTADIDNIDDITYVSWIKKTRNGSYERIVGNNSASSNWSWLFQTTNGNVLQFSVYSDGNKFLNSTGTITDLTEFHHIAAAYEATVGVKFYIDGVLDTTSGALSGSFTDTLPDIGGGVDFGRIKSSSTYYYGQFLQDETAIFTSTLSITDINDIMDNGLVQAAAGGRIRRFF